MLDFEDEFVPSQEVRGVRGKNKPTISFGGEINKNRRTSTFFFEDETIEEHQEQDIRNNVRRGSMFEFEDVA